MSLVREASMYRRNSAILAVVFVSLFAAAARASDIGHEIAAQVDVATYQYFLDELLGAYGAVCE